MGTRGLRRLSVALACGVLAASACSSGTGSDRPHPGVTATSNRLALLTDATGLRLRIAANDSSTPDARMLDVDTGRLSALPAWAKPARLRASFGFFAIPHGFVVQAGRSAIVRKNKSPITLSGLIVPGDGKTLIRVLTDPDRVETIDYAGRVLTPPIDLPTVFQPTSAANGKLLGAELDMPVEENLAFGNRENAGRPLRILAIDPRSGAASIVWPRPASAVGVGDSIVVIERHHLVIRSGDSRTRVSTKRVGIAPGELSSPNHRWMAGWVRDAHGKQLWTLALLDLRTGKSVPVPGVLSHSGDGHVAWTPSSKRLVFGYEPADNGPFGVGVYRLGAATAYRSAVELPNTSDWAIEVLP